MDTKKWSDRKIDGMHCDEECKFISNELCMVPNKIFLAVWRKWDGEARKFKRTLACMNNAEIREV